VHAANIGGLWLRVHDCVERLAQRAHAGFATEQLIRDWSSHAPSNGSRTDSNVAIWAPFDIGHVLEPIVAGQLWSDSPRECEDLESSRA
jgi:hypothetical protein